MMDHRGKVLSEINVTPLVDVMLVLLIIFMVAAPMMQRGINVDLPETKTASQVEEARLVLSIDEQNKIYVNERPIHLAILKDQLIEFYGHQTSQVLFIKADKKISYGTVLQVMDQVRQAGFEKISMVTSPISEHEEES